MIILSLIYFGLAAFFVVFQTNILQLFSIAGIFPMPDFAYIILVYISFTQGTMLGQVVGFGSGIVFDFLSLSPFGFNAFLRTACGHIIGRFKGAILLDNLLLPMVVVAASMILKIVLTIVTSVIIGQAYLIQRLFTLDALFEILLTVVLAPLIFWPLRILSTLILSRKAYH